MSFASVIGPEADEKLGLRFLGNTLNAFSFHYTYAYIDDEEGAKDDMQEGATSERPSGYVRKGKRVPETRLVVANNNPRHGVQFFSLPSLTRHVTTIACPDMRNR